MSALEKTDAVGKPVNRMTLTETQFDLRSYQPLTERGVRRDEAFLQRSADLWARIDAEVAAGRLKSDR